MSKDVLEDMKSIARNKFDAGKADLLMNEFIPGKIWMFLIPGMVQNPDIMKYLK